METLLRLISAIIAALTKFISALASLDQGTIAIIAVALGFIVIGIVVAK